MYLYIKVDKAFAIVGEPLTYTVTLYNDEENGVKEVALVSYGAEELEMIKHSLAVEEISWQGNMREGVYIGPLGVGERKTVVWQSYAKVIPMMHSLTNTIDATYWLEKDGHKKIIQSNTVITLITDPCLSEEMGSIILKRDKEVIDIEDEINYTLTIMNRGNTSAFDVRLQPIVDPYCILLEEDQVKTKLHIKQLEVGQQYEVTYKMVCKTIPDSYELSHQMQLSYDFYFANRQMVSQNYTTKPHSIAIETATFQETLGGIQKTVSVRQCTVGDSIDYTLWFTNKGNKQAEKVYYQEKIPEGTQWIPKSVLINGVPKNKGTLQDGILLGDIASGETVHLVYSLQVGEQIPRKNPIGENGKLVYSYEKNNQKVQREMSLIKDTVWVEGGILYQNKEASSLITLQKKRVPLHETVEGTIVLINEGNQTVEKIQVFIELPKEVSSTEQVIRVGDNILPSQSLQIPFSIQAHAIPKGEIVQLRAKINYEYALNKRRIKKEMTLLHEEGLVVQMPILSVAEGGLVKRVDKKVAQLGDSLHYTIELHNKGNLPAQNVRLKEVIDEKLCLVDHAIASEGGIEVGDIPVGAKKTVSYEAKIITKDVGCSICPTTMVHYNYQLGEERHTYREQEDTCQTVIEMAQIQGSLKASKVLAALGEELSYELVLENTGNIPAFDIQVILPEQQGGKWRHEALTIPKMDRGERIQKIYIFEVDTFVKEEKIDLWLQLNYQFKTSQGIELEGHFQTDTQTLALFGANMKSSEGSIQKSVDCQQAIKGDVITYTLSFNNTGNRTAQKVTVQELLGEGLRFRAGTLYVRGYSQEEPVDWEKICLGDIRPQEVCTMSYQAEVIGLPTEKVARPCSYISYTYKYKEDDITSYEATESIESNPVTILYPKIEVGTGSFKQSVEPSIGDLGDILTYTIEMMNIGNATAHIPHYQVELDKTLQFLPESLYVNQEQRYDQLSHIQLPDMPIDSTCHLVFKAKVMEVSKDARCIVGGRLVYEVEKTARSRCEVVENAEPVVAMIYTAGPLQQEAFLQALAKKHARIGDHIEGTYNLKNTGNKPMQHVKLSIPKENPWLKEIESCTIDYIEVGEIREEKLMLEVMAIPKEPCVTLAAQVVYSYEQDKKLKKGISYSTQGSICIEDTGLKQEGQVCFEADKVYVEKGEYIQYQVNLKNDGNIVAYHITGKIELDEGIVLQKDSMTCYEVNQKETPLQSLYVERLEPAENLCIRFRGKVVDVPDSGLCETKLKVTYSYKDAYQVLQIETLPIQTIVTTIRSVDFGEVWAEKTLTTQEVTIGEKIGYELRCTNKGNIAAHNIIMKQAFPQGIKMIKESLMRDHKERLAWQGSSEISVGKLEALQSTTISFEGYVDALNDERKWEDKTYLTYESEVNPKELRQKTTTPIGHSLQVVAPQIDIEVDLGTKEALIGEVLDVKVRLTNRGTQDAGQIDLGKLLPETYFELEDKTPYRIEKGLAKQETLIETLKVKVIGPLKGGDITFVPEVSYHFLVRQEVVGGSDMGRRIELTVQTVHLEVGISSDKEGKKVQTGERVTYMLSLINKGTISIKEVKIQYTVPKEMKYVDGNMLTKNRRIGIQQLQEGINIGIIEPGEEVKVQCNEVMLGYKEKRLAHEMRVSYKYGLIDQALWEGDTSAIHELGVLSPYTKKIPKNQVFVIPASLPDITEVREVKISVPLVGIRHKNEQTKELEVAMQIQYVLSYVTGEKKTLQEVSMEKLLVEKVAYGTEPKGAEAINVEVAQKAINLMNKRQVEVWSEITIEI
ncbi:MAG: hypothetical protein ACRDDX_03135 [Cellulosilyticaceae bacterium]